MHRQSERDSRQTRSIPGHPDDASFLVDAIGHKSTPSTEPIEEDLSKSFDHLQSIQGQVNSLLAAQHDGQIPTNHSRLYYEQNAMPPAPFENLEAMMSARDADIEQTSQGTELSDVYFPWTIIQNPPKADQVSLEMLLANQCHLGHATALWHPGNSGYIFGIRHGIHIISLEITLSYLRRAAKVVQEVARRGGIILFVGTRNNMREIVVGSAQRAEGYHIFTRWIPGTLTNGQQILENSAVKIVNAKDQELTQYAEALRQSSHATLRPDLVVCLNPLENEVCLHECGLYNVPTIGIVDTDVNPSWVTYPIPANDDSTRSVALVSGVLSQAAKKGQEMRRQAAEEGIITYSTARANKFLQGMEEVAGMDVAAPESREKKGRNDD